MLDAWCYYGNIVYYHLHMNMYMYMHMHACAKRHPWQPQRKLVEKKCRKSYPLITTKGTQSWARDGRRPQVAARPFTTVVNQHCYRRCCHGNRPLGTHRNEGMKPCLVHFLFSHNYATGDAETYWHTIHVSEYTP